MKYKREAMALAIDRDELVFKELALKQLTFLLIAARQKLLSIAPKFGNRFGRGQSIPVDTGVEYLEREIHDVLVELANLPLAVEEDWLKRLEEEEG